MANIGMDMPTDCPRTEPAASLMTEKQTCAYLNVSYTDCQKLLPKRGTIRVCIWMGN